MFVLRQPRTRVRKRGTPLYLVWALIALLGLAFFAAPVSRGNAGTDKTVAETGGGALTPDQAQEVLRLFRQYMTEHPEEIVGALEAYAKREESARSNEVVRTLEDARIEVERDQGSFIGGNPDGDISLTEFFDYRCSYCKRVHDTVQALLKKDGNLRFVYKEFPILGPDSVVAARAALAARMQGKYLPYHNALMTTRGALDRERILEIADDVGLDVARLEHDMKDPEIEKIIARNHALAQRLNIGGTPAFVIGDEIIAGAAELGRFTSLVDLARTNCATC